MHELGIVIEIVKTVERFAKQHQVTVIDTLVLQIGELSSVVPHYVKEVYPIAVEKTMLEKTKLTIEILPGNGFCTSCNKVFNILKHKQTCPYCQSNQFDILSGKECQIKEIIAK